MLANSIAFFFVHTLPQGVQKQKTTAFGASAGPRRGLGTAIIAQFLSIPPTVRPASADKPPAATILPAG